jgi:hypothetical protein
VISFCLYLIPRYIAALMEPDTVRRFIGNSQAVIIFDESKSPFDPSEFYAGRDSRSLELSEFVFCFLFVFFF